MRILVTIPMSDPEPRTPAPGSLLLVQQFLNSTDLPDGVDELGTPPLASEWLARVTGVPVTVSEKQHARLVATREALRDLLEAHTGDNVDPGVRVRLQKLLGHSPLRPVFTDAGATLAVDCAGVDSFLGMISTAIVEATM